MEKNVEKNVEKENVEMKEVKFDEMVNILVKNGLNEEGIEYLKNWFGVRWSKKKEGGRKEEVYKILEESAEGVSVKEIGEKLNISGGNVSSILLYLRRDGVEIVSIDGKKILKKYLGNLVK